MTTASSTGMASVMTGIANEREAESGEHLHEGGNEDRHRHHDQLAGGHGRQCARTP